MSAQPPRRIIRRKRSEEDPTGLAATVSPPAPSAFTKAVEVQERSGSDAPTKKNLDRSQGRMGASRPSLPLASRSQAGPPPTTKTGGGAASPKGSHGASSSSTPPAASSSPSPASPLTFEAARGVAIDRAIFSSINFSAPTFVNNITNRILFPILMRLKQDVKRGTLGGGSERASSSNTMLRGNDGGALFSSDKLPLSVRQVDRSGEEADEPCFLAVAGNLSVALEHSSDEISKLLAEEDALLQWQEVRCKRVEIREKKQLAHIRLGLEATTTRLHEYENRVSNAQTAMAGIEQHLSQANARVLRGRSVSQLLRYFKMLISIPQAELTNALKVLSKARVGQRVAVTEKWKSGRVAAFNPRFYTTSTSGIPISDEAQNNTMRKDGDGDGSGGEFGVEAAANSEDEDDFSGDEDDNADGYKEEVSSTFKLHRAEAAAVSAGLDRTFAARAYTETQVEWCQKLQLLARELGDVVPNTGNIETYTLWLRQELVSDMFHIIACFSTFYDENPQTAAHLSFGRALLKTLELTSRMYTTVTPSTDALLSVFFSRSINDLGVTLFSEYSPRPLPSQPPLPNPSPLLAMDHFKRCTEADLYGAFAFLVSRVKREVIVVETIFGVTNTARQQLLAQVTEGVIKPFIKQQIKLAETHETAMLNAEGTLSPRTKRRCNVRVADAIAYKLSTETRLFTLFADFVKELRKHFSNDEVDVVSRLTDNIFSERAAVSKNRFAVELLNRYHTIIEDKYTRSLYPVNEEFFDLREAHMTKSREIANTLLEVAKLVRAYVIPSEVGRYTVALITTSLKFMGAFLDVELRKTYDSIRADRDNWRLRPKSEEELLRPPKPESQQCGFRMLLYAQSTLMSYNESILLVCTPILHLYTRLLPEVEEARAAALEAMDERAEKLLNMSTQAVIVRSLAILMHYQGKNDYMPKSKEQNFIAPPCTRACTLFCYYVTRQFEEAKEFIHLSNGQTVGGTSGRELVGVEAGSAAALREVNQAAATERAMANAAALAGGEVGIIRGDVSPSLTKGSGTSTRLGDAQVGLTPMDASRARARAMNLQQLLFGDGGPSSFVRTLGVCLYRGIATHLKSFTANDRGTLIFKQDVTAYREAMTPLYSTPGLGGAVVGVLFQILKETSSLLIMPLDHIKAVKNSGLLKLMPGEEQARFIRIRLDVREAFNAIDN